MNWTVRAFQKVPVVLVAFCLVSTEIVHQRQKRFVFYPGSVVQLAVGVALPAEIPKKIVFINYGIMINYLLPTNLSSLLPATIIDQARTSTTTGHLSADLLLKFGFNKACRNTLENWISQNSNMEGDLIFDLILLIIREVEEIEMWKPGIFDDNFTGHSSPFFRFLGCS